MIYDNIIKLANGDNLDFNTFKNKVLLIVNIATRCGYTKQLTDLEKLYNKYKDDGFVIVGLPSNEFFRQSPGDDKEILSFCELNYNTTFPVTTKIRVNTKKAHPLYLELREKAGLKKIPWNFYKFLIGKNGEIISHHHPKVTPFELENDIKTALGI